LSRLQGNNRLPKHALNYKPPRRPRKPWLRVDPGTGQTTQSMEVLDDDDDDDDDDYKYEPYRSESSLYFTSSLHLH